jgi:hypothetical protein
MGPYFTTLILTVFSYSPFPQSRSVTLPYFLVCHLIIGFLEISNSNPIVTPSCAFLENSFFFLCQRLPIQQGSTKHQHIETIGLKPRSTCSNPHSSTLLPYADDGLAINIAALYEYKPAPNLSCPYSHHYRSIETLPKWCFREMLMETNSTMIWKSMIESSR